MAETILKQRICAIPLPDHKDAAWVNLEVAGNRLRDARILEKLIVEVLVASDPGNAKDLRKAREEIYVLGDALRRELKKAHKTIDAVRDALIAERFAK